MLLTLDNSHLLSLTFETLQYLTSECSMTSLTEMFFPLKLAIIENCII